MLKRELADITRRGQAAEARHEELASAMPEATRPLLRQIEAMQAAATAHSQAWAAAERSLNDRLSAAEAQAAASGVVTVTQHVRVLALRVLAKDAKVARLHHAAITGMVPFLHAQSAWNQHLIWHASSSWCPRCQAQLGMYAVRCR